MTRQEAAVLADLAAALARLFKGETPQRVECSGSAREELRQACEAANRLIDTLSGSREFLLALAEGKLGVEAPARSLLLSPFKQLQANLRHLTWQTQQIVLGDLNQRVDFLGEFSTAFNTMIDSLKDKRAVEEQLRRSEKELKDITSALGEGVCMLDAEGKLSFINPEAERLLGWQAAELPGKSLSQTIYPRARESDGDAKHNGRLLQTLRTGETIRVADDVFVRRDGSPLPVAFVVTPVTEGKRITGAVIAFHDITAIKSAREALERANEVLSHQATTDAVTGVPNRLLFNVAMEREIRKAKRYGFPLSIVILDIDCFKRVNDDFGHGVGDVVLRELAMLVSARLRQGDVFARWGGDEFVIMLPYTEGTGACTLAERVRVAIEQHTFSTSQRITCSFGVAPSISGETLRELIERADKALYRAKDAGRNRVEVAEGHPGEVN